MVTLVGLGVALGTSVGVAVSLGTSTAVDMLARVGVVIGFKFVSGGGFDTTGPVFSEEGVGDGMAGWIGTVLLDLPGCTVFCESAIPEVGVEVNGGRIAVAGPST